MFVGLGSGAFSAGIWHLVTHAFFKALLFLGAGSVGSTPAMATQDMRHMAGGLRNYAPITFWTLLTAALVPFPESRLRRILSKRTAILVARFTSMRAPGCSGSSGHRVVGGA